MKRIIAIVLIVLCALLCGCSALSLEEEDILAVPKASGDESEVISLIAQNFSSSFELVYPLSGKNKNAVTICDTGRSAEEAVAVFRRKDDPGMTQILFARKGGGGFSYRGSSSIPTNVIDRVDFADLDGDGKKEILIGYQGASSSQKSIAIYRTDEEISVTDVAACYSRLVLGDFNSDGADEALCVTRGSSDEAPLAVLMGYHPVKGLLTISACALDSDAEEIENLVFGNISEDLAGAVIDERKGDGEYITEALYYSKEQKLLLNPVFIFEDAEDTERSIPLLSKDIDSDGIIEIPTVERSSAPADEDDSSYCDVVIWKNLDFSTYSMSKKKSAVICPDGDYTFTLPQEIEDSVTAKYDSEERKLSLYSVSYDRDGIHLLDELLYIKTYPKEDYQENRVIEAKLYESPSNVYTYLLKNTGSEYAFTDTQAEKSFEILQAH